MSGYLFGVAMLLSVCNATIMGGCLMRRVPLPLWMWGTVSAAFAAMILGWLV